MVKPGKFGMFGMFAVADGGKVGGVGGVTTPGKQIVRSALETVPPTHWMHRELPGMGWNVLSGHGVHEVAKLMLAPERKVPAGHGEQPCNSLKKNPSLQKHVVRCVFGAELAVHEMQEVAKLVLSVGRKVPSGHMVQA